MNYDPIDIVILWVDDQDIKWKEKKNYWQKKIGILDSQEERYRNWDNLHYLFRGIEKFASWVNHIFLVTDNQIPKWLNEESNKITIIDHTEIINKNYLPTFNSRSIELNLHKIPNLSENFIYFNDDMFLINDTSPTDFFVEGKPKDMGILNALTPIKNNTLSGVLFNNITIINENFKVNTTLKNEPFKWFNYKYGLMLSKNILLFPWKNFSGFHDHHLPSNFNKKTFDYIWEEYDEELKETVKTKFRHENNYNQWLMRYWQLASNDFVPMSANFGKYFNLKNKKETKKCVNHIIKQKSKVICVNDNEYIEHFEYSKNQVNDAFNRILPQKSQFEK